MKTLALAVLLAVMQTSTPVPRKTADPSNRTPQNVESDSDGKKAPSQQPPTIIKPISAQPDQSDSHAPTNENTQQPVIVRELPPVSVTKDWWDRIYICFTGILIVVGTLGVRAAYKSLKAIQGQTEQIKKSVEGIERQAGIMEKQTAAMNQSVEIFVSKERARVGVMLTPLKLDVPDTPTTVQEVKYRIEIIHGSTPAFITDSSAIAYVSDQQEPSRDMRSPPWTAERVLLPGAAIAGSTFLTRKWNNLTQAEIDSIMDSKLFVYFQGFIKYKDAFDRERETNVMRVWAIIMRFSDGETLGHWVKCGGEADNRET